MVHLYFNIIGTAIFMSLFYFLHLFVDFSFMSQAAGPAGIAVIHSMFNIFATLVLLPFSKGLEKLACLTIRDKKNTQAPAVENQEFSRWISVSWRNRLSLWSRAVMQPPEWLRAHKTLFPMLCLF